MSPLWPLVVALVFCLVLHAAVRRATRGRARWGIDQ